MSAVVIHNKEIEKKIMKLVPRKGVAFWKRNLRGVIEQILKALLLKISVEGFEATEIEGGFHFKSNAEAVNPPVWDFTHDGDNIAVGSGVVQGHVVNGITFFPGTTGTTRYVYITVNEVLSVTAGFVNSFAYNGATMHAGGVIPDDDMSSGIYQIPIMKFQDGVLESRYESTSLACDVIDDGTSTGLGRFRYGPA